MLRKEAERCGVESNENLQADAGHVRGRGKVGLMCQDLGGNWKIRTLGVNFEERWLRSFVDAKRTTLQLSKRRDNFTMKDNTAQ
jgi:hypothetical protein